MSTASTLSNHLTPTIRSAVRTLLDGIWCSARKRQLGIHPRYESRYQMRYEDLLGQPLHNEIRRAWWL